MAYERIELEEVQGILDDLSSPSDEEFVQALRGFSDTGIAMAAAKRGLGEVGGASLPDWWEVVSTPGSESVTLAGQVVIEPSTPGTPALVVQSPDPIVDSLDLQVWNDVNGDKLADFDSQGNFVIFSAGTPRLTLANKGQIVVVGDSAILSPTDPVFRVLHGGSLIMQGTKQNGLSVGAAQTNGQALSSSAFDETTPVFVGFCEPNYNGEFVVTGTGALDMVEQAEPDAPASNTARLFVQDAAGKTQLLVRFPSGASQVIATEP